MKSKSEFIKLVLFCVGSLALFYPNLHRTFASDDFEVIGRIAWDKQLILHGTFRPLSDITLLFNYLIGGWHPAGYYVFNILVHGINSYLVYRFCLKWGSEYAWLAALFFLAYPFHSEGIDWILGRGASLCTLFGLAAIVVAISGMSLRLRLFWAGLFYFIGMAAYEPVMLLPFFILIVLYIYKTHRSEWRKWSLMLAGVFVLHVAVRLIVSGNIVGDYGAGFFGDGIGHLLTNVVKVGGRLLLPPSDHTGEQIALFAGALILLAGILYLFRKRARPEERSYLAALVLLLAVSCVIPVLTAVSTRTSESDRLLYLPSVFLCCILAFLIVTLVKQRSWRWGAAVVILIYLVVFLERTNANWLEADAIVKDILHTTADDGRSGDGRTFILDLPDEKDGAFIFRHGFPEAWRLAGRADSMLVVVNHLTRDEEILHSLSAFTVRRISADSLLLVGPHGTTLRAGGKDRIFRWDQKKMVLLSLP